MRSSIFKSGALLFAALALVACSDDNAIRSPDLPPPQLIGIGAISCTPTSVAVGTTASCVVSGGCLYRAVNANGSTTEQTGVCPSDIRFNSSAPNVASIDGDTGVATGVAPGTTQINASGGGQSSEPTTLTVTAACVDTSDPNNFVINQPNVTIPAGLPVTYSATLRLNNGTTRVVTTANTVWADSNDPGDVVQFAANVASTRDDVTAAVTVAVTATYTPTTGSTPLCGSPAPTSVSASTNLTVQPATLVTTDALCIETVPPATAIPAGGRADSGACGNATILEFLLTSPAQTKQLQIRGRYNNGREYDVTQTATLGTNPTGRITISATGLATAVAAGDTSITAALGGRTANRPAQVKVNQVFGKNSFAVSQSLLASGKPINFGNADRFACVGANDLVSGLAGRTPRGSLALHAAARTCSSDALDADGNCTATDADGNPIAFELTDEVTDQLPKSLATGADPLDDGIKWSAQPGYWAGVDGCQTASSGAGGDNPPARVGDLCVIDPLTNACRSPRQLLLGDDDLPAAGGDPTGQPNGLAYSDAAVRLGFACVTAEYTNPQNPSQKLTDGMTVLVLPATNDVLLGQSGDGAQLCDKLEPLFTNPLLGVLEGAPLLDGLSRIELLTVLSGVTEAVNPVLEQLDALPLDTIITTLVTGGNISPVGLATLTSLIIGPLDEGVIDPILEPVVCQVTNVVNLILGALTGGGNNQQCPALPFP